MPWLLQLNSGKTCRQQIAMYADLLNRVLNKCYGMPWIVSCYILHVRWKAKRINLIIVVIGDCGSRKDARLQFAGEDKVSTWKIRPLRELLSTKGHELISTR